MVPAPSVGPTLLPDVRIIGFTGHRHLKNPEGVATALRAELAELQKKDGELVAISSVAIGGDMLFAREVLQAGIKWIVILPLAREDFRKDFTVEEWARAEDLIKHAAEVRTLPGIDRPEVYVDCGKATVDDSDCLLALWDGMPAAGPGGTAEIVAYARRLGRELTLFREGATQVEKMDTARVLAHEFKPEDVLETMGPRPELPLPPQSLLNQFKASDEEATRTAPNFRNRTLWMARFHLAATLVAGLALSVQAHRFFVTGFTLSVLGFHYFVYPTIVLAIFKTIFVVFALVILIWLWWRRTHEIWLQQRLTAEYCRSILATWHCRDPVEPVSFHELPALRAVSQAALFLRLEKDRRAPVDIKDFRTAYAHDRVMDQWNYFRGQWESAKAMAGPIRFRYWTYTVFAVIFSVLLLVLRSFSHQFTTDNFEGSSLRTQAFVVFLDVFPLALPAAASFTIAHMAIKDVDRRIGRFQDLQNQMGSALIDLSLCGSWECLHRSVERTERILFNEVLEWHSISRYSPTG